MNVLVVAPVFPQPDKNSGCLRLVEILGILRRDGHSITVLAIDQKEPKYRQALEQEQIRCAALDEVFPNEHVVKLRQFLESSHFEVAIFEHYDVYTEYAQYVRAFLPECWLILDTVDLHFVRLRREAELNANPIALKSYNEVWMNETRSIKDADAVWVVTEVERQIVIEKTLAASEAVHVVPNIHRLISNVPDFEQRTGLIFLGGYSHPPNIDAVKHLVEDILPHLGTAHPGFHVTIAGSNPPEFFQVYSQQDSRVNVTGFVEDHRALLSSHLVGVAPLRYGAGMKGKIGEYMACGLPCVTTSIGAEGMGLRDGQEVLIADSPAEFCEAITRISRDPILWKRLSQGGLNYISRNLSRESIAPLISKGMRIGRGRRRQPTGNMLINALRRPEKWNGLVKRAVSAFRRGGIQELVSSAKQWTNRL